MDLKLQRKQLGCTYDNFKAKYDGTDNFAFPPQSALCSLRWLELSELHTRIDRLVDEFKSLDPDGEVGGRLYAALAPVLSYDWLGCESLVHDKLLTKATSIQSIESDHCLRQLGSAAWLADPCCNPSLSITQCCNPKFLSVAQTAVTPNVEAIRKMCMAPNCAQVRFSRILISFQWKLIFFWSCREIAPRIFHIYCPLLLICKVNVHK